MQHHRSCRRWHDEASAWGRDTAKASRGGGVERPGIVSTNGAAPVVVGCGLGRGVGGVVRVWSRAMRSGLGDAHRGGVESGRVLLHRVAG